MIARRAGLASPRLWLGGLAASGIVAGHSLAFFLSAPDPHERSELLASTGHRYWSMAVAVALGGLVAGLSSLLVGFARRHREGSPPRMFAFAAPRLAMLQMGGFLVLEAGERAVAHGGVGHLLEEPVVIAGLVLQLVVALGAAAILTLLVRAVHAILDGFTKKRRGEAPRVLPRPALRLPRPAFELGVGSGTWRGPPTGF